MTFKPNTPTVEPLGDNDARIRTRTALLSCGIDPTPVRAWSRFDPWVCLCFPQQAPSREGTTPLVGAVSRVVVRDEIREVLTIGGDAIKPKT